MTIQQLEYVAAVARTRSFTRAADECFVTQPTLSAQIGKLEVELGCRLFDRLQKPVAPTAAGRLVLAHAAPALAHLRQIPANLEHRRHELAGQCRIGVIPTVSQYLLPLFLKGFLDAYPAIDVEVHEEISDRIIEDIRSYRIDIGILALPTGSSGLDEIGLYHEEFVGYFPDSYELVAGGLPDTLTANQLIWKDMLLLAEGHCFREQTIDICHRQEVKESSRLEFESGSIESIKRFVEQGLGYTLLPELATRGLGAHEQSRLRRFADPPPTRHVGLIVHPGYIQRDLLEALKRSIVGALPGKIRENTGANHIPWRS